MAAPFGAILTSEDDFNAIRHMLGAEPWEVGDDLIGEPQVLGAAEQFVMQQIPNWGIILQLAAPAAPTVGSVAQAGSLLLAGSYYVALVARVNDTVSPAGAETGPATLATSNTNVLQLTPPSTPGVTGYDIYVGVASGQEYLQQANWAPGVQFTLAQFSMAGQAIQAVSAGDVANLRAATYATCCAMLCKRFRTRKPKSVSMQTWMERIDVDWREEEAHYVADASFHFGLVSTYIPRLNAPPSALAAHPQAGPTSPEYRTGSDPLAEPNPWPQWPSH